RGNVATSSSILMRADAAKRWSPIPVGFADWYFALRAALEGGLAYLPEPRTLYRFHGENMSLGTSGARRVGQLRDSLELQRWFLRRVEPRADLAAAWQAFEAFVLELMAAAETPFTALFEVTGEDRAEARALAEQSLAERSLALAVRASAADPWSEAATR